MFPLGHIYTAMRITNRDDAAFLFGSIFPDIPMTGVIGWKEMEYREARWASRMMRVPKLRAFAKGVLLHEHPIGVDRFVHGHDYVNGNGYAMRRGKKLYHLLPLFHEPIRAVVAHGFIECAMEERLRQQRPELELRLRNVLREIRPLVPAISKAFAAEFRLHPFVARAGIELYLLMNRALLRFPRLVFFGFEWLTLLREGRWLWPSTFRKALAASHSSIAKDFNAFMDEVVEKCRKEWNLLHQPALL
ncbi:hypothetical protein HY492_01285 [Candidatus Woesearchaeota archaeon]|nr:hypothetical protein [Candidatus Woesearchaeota archaeon]